MDLFKNIIDFIQNQLLGMQWLNFLIGNILNFFGINIDTKFGSIIQFFIYDTIKIILLLFIMIFIISYIQSYFPPERTKKILSKYGGIKGNIMGALLGTVTPFCSCSSIPIFMGFTNAGVPLGVSFSFLISSPLVDLGAFVLLVGAFGFKISLIYVVIGLTLAVIGGIIIDKLKLQRYVEEYKNENPLYNETYENKKQRFVYSKNETLFIVKKVYLYVIVGVAIGAFIHNWIPQTWIEGVIGEKNPLSVILSTILGIPMYADIFGTIPIAQALIGKGVEVGTVISFMMSVTALSLPSIIMLKKIIKPKLLIIFISIVTIGIIIIGYGLNLLI